MAALLPACSKEEQCTVRELLAESIRRAKIRPIRSAQYGNSALPQRSVYERITMFKNRNTNIAGEKRSASLSTSTKKKNFDRFLTKILVNRRVTLHEVMSHLHISNGSTH
jgi:hypothetical protein